MDTSERKQSPHALLAEVLHATTEVAGPFVGRSLDSIVDRDESELAEPVSEVALGVDKARGNAGAHGNAKDGVAVQRHRSSERRDVTVVEDLKGNLPFLSQVQKHAFHFGVKDCGVSHAAKERGDAHLVVDVNARCGATNGVDARQVRGGNLQGVADALEMVSGVRLEIGIPFYFLRKDDLAVDDGRALPVGAAEVEANAASSEVTTQGEVRRAFGRQVLFGDHPEGQRKFEQLARKLCVEGANATGGVHGLQLLG